MQPEQNASCKKAERGPLLHAQRRIRHAKLCSKVLGKKLNGRFILYGIGLREVLHGFHQQALPFHIARIGATFPFATPRIRCYRNRKNFTHYSPAYQNCPAVGTPHAAPMVAQYSRGITSRLENVLIPFNSGQSLRFGLEDVVRQFFVDLDIAVLGEFVIASGREGLLLYRNSIGRIDPKHDAIKHVLHPSRLRS